MFDSRFLPHLACKPNINVGLRKKLYENFLEFSASNELDSINLQCAERATAQSGAPVMPWCSQVSPALALRHAASASACDRCPKPRPAVLFA